MALVLRGLSRHLWCTGAGQRVDSHWSFEDSSAAIAGFFTLGFHFGWKAAAVCYEASCQRCRWGWEETPFNESGRHAILSGCAPFGERVVPMSGAPQEQLWPPELVKQWKVLARGLEGSEGEATPDSP